MQEAEKLVASETGVDETIKWGHGSRINIVLAARRIFGRIMQRGQFQHCCPK
jgi:hypothetical protein